MTKALNLSAEQSRWRVWFCKVTGFLPTKSRDRRLPVATEKRGVYFLYNNNMYLGDTTNNHHFL